jgi:hypothetical protein
MDRHELLSVRYAQVRAGIRASGRLENRVKSILAGYASHSSVASDAKRLPKP